MLKQNKIYIFALILSILAFSIKLYTDKRPRTADLSSVESLIKTEVVGIGSDTKVYFVASYAVFKNFIPKIEYQEKDYFVCYRPTSSLVFAPLMFIFREYFPVFGILIFSIMTYLSSAYLLRSIGLSFIPSAVLLLFIFIFTFYYAPSLTIGPPILSLLAISLALYIKGKILLSAIFLFFASLIRPEFSIVGFLYLLKTRKLSLSFLFISPIFALTLQNICGDQSFFYYWTHKAYLTNVEKNYNLEKVRNDLRECVLNKSGINQNIEVHTLNYMIRTYPFSSYFSDCVKEKFEKEVKWKINIIAKYFTENILFLSVVPKTRRFNLLFPISIIFGILTILGLIFYFERDWFIPASYISIVVIYAIYFPYGLSEFARFKLHILPFEIILIAQLHRDKVQNIQTRITKILFMPKIFKRC